MLIGICGGIGSGKSVVSRLLRGNGYRVYDCDTEARRLMETSAEIKRRIRDEISPDVTDGVSAPNRKLLAEIVFNNEKARIKLNAITHGALADDIKGVVAALRPGEILFVEAAVLAESGLAEICDRIWRVEANLGERIRRIVNRDKCSARHAEQRMLSQRTEEGLLKKYVDKTDLIHNDDRHSVMARVEQLCVALLGNMGK